MVLKNKTVVLGVTGGIAAYKALELTSRLKKAGADVKIIMTKAAAEFVAPLSFRSLSQNPVALDMFEEPNAWEIRHISLAKAADVFAVVPATANFLGKAANGIADDMLTTTYMACVAPKLIAPAMNTNMFENPVTQENIKKLKALGAEFVMPAEGRLACGDAGIGKLADIDLIFDNIARLALSKDADLKGKKVVVSAGATTESLDPVRFLTNHSSGKMGFAIAKAAYLRGADVTLVAGAHTCPEARGVKTVNVSSALEMRGAVLSVAEDADIIIMAAAVADYRPKNISASKIKKIGGEMSLELTRNPDILKELGVKYAGKKVIVGFAMETEDLIKNAAEKCAAKGADFIVANNLNTAGAGFGTDTNVASIVRQDGTAEDLPKMSKDELAGIILTEAAKL